MEVEANVNINTNSNDDKSKWSIENMLGHINVLNILSIFYGLPNDSGSNETIQNICTVVLCAIISAATFTAVSLSF